ncbi:MAG: SH3 domain-containing protein [Caldilineaceae bacterium]|nr:SH3 domain-containing protein [Caldilineaceae bacterium]
MSTFRSSLNRFPTARRVLVLPLLAAVFVLAGCATDPMTVNEILQAMPGLTQGPPSGIQMLDNSAEAAAGEAAAAEASQENASVDAPGVTAVEIANSAPITDSGTLSATVTVKNRSVNIRSGPGLDFSVLNGAAQGDTFTALGMSDDEAWWQICCIPGPNDEKDNPTQKAWISNRVVDVSEAAAALGVLRPLFPDDLTATWDVSYQCGSERCPVAECAAQVSASVRNDADPRWLEIDRVVTWDEGCGEDSTWLHQIDRADGLERYPNSTGLFFFNYWVGAKPGPANSLYTLGNAEIASWCGDPQTAEVEEEGGWTSAYDGVTCYDERTGMLVAMKYTKRWLFTGEFEGEEYEKAYFGDFEVYEVALKETNVELDIENGD